ncbi:MAG: hypothetical protein GY834_15440 [Bacteroidetes bacterium]|nr:hypothetical protein [Bacteroidota bacterium]
MGCKEWDECFIHCRISPILMEVSDRGFYLTLRYNAESTQKVIQLLEKKGKEFSSNYPFESVRR